MKIPKRLQPLVDDGLVDEVIRPLMSGKEAVVYVVRCGSEIRCAKVYKESDKRSFKQAVQYQEGRKVRNGRRARAMEKGSKYGRDQQDEAWQTAEVEALYRLADAGVECIGCGVCYAACDVVGWRPDYIGPAALNRAWTLVNDERDGAGELGGGDQKPE